MSETSNDILQLLLAEIDADPGASVFPNLAEAYRQVGQPERAREIAANGLDHAPERMAGRVALGLALLDLDETDEARRVLSAILEDVPELMALLEQAPSSEASAQPESASVERPREDPFEEQRFEEAGAEPPRPQEARPDLLGDDEIDHAFDEAEAQPDEMIDVNDVAEAALRDEQLDAPEVGFAPGEHPVFATATMADLLERQGDSRSAETIRSSLVAADPGGESAGAESADEEREDPLSAVADEIVAQEAEMDAAEAPEAAPVALEATEPETPGGGQAAEHATARKARIISTLESWLENIRRDVA